MARVDAASPGGPGVTQWNISQIRWPGDACAVITVGEETSLGEVARLLTTRRIKRVPVVRDGRIVGIVSRADMVRALLAE